tara:strand:+ start:67 stop:903 length:837 start_codon:yes stop_codon:yes gene_type:complete
MKLSNNLLKSKKIIIIKSFSDNERFKREKYFYDIFQNKNLNIPKVLNVSKKTISFKRYDFKKVYSQKKFFDGLLNFLKKINKEKNYALFAKENLKSYNSLHREVRKRFEKLSKLKIEKKYRNKMNKIQLYIKKILQENHKKVKLKKIKNIISQSDIGFHNCAVFNNKIFFYDFEYSGLDHPFKLICDTYYQPEKKVDKSHILIFIKSLEKRFKFKLPKNFSIFERLLKVKMMLIILNIFVLSNISKKSKSIEFKKINKLKSERLNKAFKYIKFPFIYE